MKPNARAFADLIWKLEQEKKLDKAQFAALAATLLKRGAGRLLPQIEQILIKKETEAKEITLVRVRSAHPLSPLEEKTLKTQLTTRLGRKIELRTSVEPSLKAGIQIQLDDLLIENTYRNHLLKLSEALGVQHG